MKKLVVFLIISNFITINAYCNDFEQGNIELTFTGSLSFSVYNSDINGLTLRLNPGLGVFIINNLELMNNLGLNINIEPGDDVYISLYYKPSFYYYFSKLKINPFISFGSSMNYFDYDEFIFGINTSIGTLIPLKNNFYFKLELMYSRYVKYQVNAFNLFFGISKIFIINN